MHASIASGPTAEVKPILPAGMAVLIRNQKSVAD